jgi:Asp/Glu/hydantoin racemase
LLEHPYDRHPGAPGFISTPESPIRFRVVEGCTVDGLVHEGDRALEQAITTAARQLVDEGARAITGNCGFMIRHQAAVSAAVDVPVLLSSLLLAPLLLACMGPDKKLAIITASAEALTPDLLALAGIADTRRTVVGDLGNQPAFRAQIMECTEDVDLSAIEEETLSVTRALVQDHSDVAAVLFECTVLPPFAARVQKSLGLPVFDSARLIDLFAAGFAPPAAQRILVDDGCVGWLSARYR